MKSSLTPLAQELLRYLSISEDGFSDENVRIHFGARYELLPPVINELLAANRLQLFTVGDAGNMLVYKSIKEETAAKFEGLGPEQILVYQAIERSGNKGVWTRDIKINTNISQSVLTKTLKILEQRSLVKSVRSVSSKSKKLYMVFDMEPAKEITGGPWYSEQEFDYEFVSELGNFIVKIVSNLGTADIFAIGEKVRISGICKIDLSTEELESVVRTLVYDYRLEETSFAGRNVYKACRVFDLDKPSATRSFFTEIPCGVCPVMNQCSEHGVISPSTCEYFQEWLASGVSSVPNRQKLGLNDW